MPIDFQAMYEKDGELHGDDYQYLKFNRIPAGRRLSNRPDLHAFLLLDRLVPGTRDMVCGASHDEIYLAVEIEELNAVATEEDAIDLIRCGVRTDEDWGLVMFA